MKIDSVTFICDVTRCSERLTTTETLPAASYLVIVEAGWKVKRPLTGPWRHVCKNHALADLK